MSSSSCSHNNCDSSCFICHALHCLGDFLQPFLLLAIRLFWGYLLFLSGSLKLADIAGTSAFFHSLNIPFSEITAHIVAYTELVSGICLMAGFATRFFSLAIIVVMLTAIFTAHTDVAFHLAPPFPFFFASLILFCFGAGQISLDYILQRFFCKKG